MMSFLTQLFLIFNLTPSTYGGGGIPLMFMPLPKLASATCNTSDSGYVQYAMQTVNYTTYASSNFALAQTAGNTNFLIVSWDTIASTVSSIYDSSGNTYTLLFGPIRNGQSTLYMYYASNIAAAAGGSNTVTVNFSPALTSNAEVQAYEYSGLATSSALDGTPVTGTATSSTNAVTSTSLSTSNACDVLVSPSYYETGVAAVGTSYKVVATPGLDLFENRVVNTTGSYSANSTQTATGHSIIGLAAFKKVSAVVKPTIHEVQQYSNQGASLSLDYDKFLMPQTAGNTNVIVVAFSNTTNTVSSVTDDAGNVYSLAVGPTRGSQQTQYIYYAKNIAAWAAGNNVKVTFNGTVNFYAIQAEEFTGLSTTSPFDVAVGNSGNTTAPTTGTVTTSFANELQIAAITTYGEYIVSFGSTYSFLFALPYNSVQFPFVGVQKLVGAAGSQSASATLSTANPWVMQTAFFH